MIAMLAPMNRITPAAERLRQAREARGLSRAALAAAAKTHHNQIQKLETGERKFTEEWMDRLAPPLGIAPSEFMSPVKRRETIEDGEYFNAIMVPEYDVRVSAGGGFAIETETKKDEWPFSRRYIENELRLTHSNLVVMEVVGDSMSPTLHSGDRVLVDMADLRVSLPGLFVLWDGDGTVVKRLELVPASKPQKLRRISDNPLHGTYEVLAADTRIIGRVVWYARRM